VPYLTLPAFPYQEAKAVSAGAIILTAIVIVLTIFSPALRRTALHAFVASVIYQIVRAVFRAK
jgi:hypothetical protein